MNGLDVNLLYVLSALLIGGGIGMIALILRGRPSGRPQGAVEWTVLVLSLVLVFLAAGFVTLSLTNDGGPSFGAERKTVVGEPAPPLHFRLVENDEEKRLSDYRGKVVLLNLWATWCPPCLDELPELNRLQEAYGWDGLVVVTISDERRETIQRFEREELPLKTVSGYLPPDREWPAPYDRVLDSRPMSFVIDRDGRIQTLWRGAADFPVFQQAVTPYL